MGRRVSEEINKDPQLKMEMEGVTGFMLKSGKGVRDILLQQQGKAGRGCGTGSARSRRRGSHCGYWGGRYVRRAGLNDMGREIWE